MSYSIRFEVEASRVEEHFGVTLFILDGDEDPEEGDEQNCYFLIFRGKSTVEPDEAARSFGACHQLAMESVGLEGQVTEEEFHDRLDSSIELAGDLMVKYGFEVLDTDHVDEHLKEALFCDTVDPVTDLSALN